MRKYKATLKRPAPNIEKRETHFPQLTASAPNATTVATQVPEMTVDEETPPKCTIIPGITDGEAGGTLSQAGKRVHEESPLDPVILPIEMEGRPSCPADWGWPGGAERGQLMSGHGLILLWPGSRKCVFT